MKIINSVINFIRKIVDNLNKNVDNLERRKLLRVGKNINRNVWLKYSKYKDSYAIINIENKYITKAKILCFCFS